MDSAPQACGPLWDWRQPLVGVSRGVVGLANGPPDGGERVSGVRTVVPMASALKGVQG